MPSRPRVMDRPTPALLKALERFAIDEPDVQDWQRSGVCREVDPELFYPERGAGNAAAKRLCAGCPVKVDCLAYALDNDERFGVWGGLSERERRRMSISMSGRLFRASA